MFFDHQDKRTDEERKRDIEFADKRRVDDMLALGCLKNTIRPLLVEAGLDVGLVGRGIVGAELLIEVDGVTYQMRVSVNHDE